MRKMVVLALFGILGSGLFAANYATDVYNATVTSIGVFQSGGNFYFNINGTGDVYYFSASGDVNKAMISVVITAYTLGYYLTFSHSSNSVTFVCSHQ